MGVITQQETAQESSTSNSIEFPLKKTNVKKNITRRRRRGIILILFIFLMGAILSIIFFYSPLRKPILKLRKDLLRRTKELPNCLDWCTSSGYLLPKFKFSQRVRCYAKCARVTYEFPIFKFLCSLSPRIKKSEACKRFSTNTRIDARSYVTLRYLLFPFFFHFFSIFIHFFQFFSIFSIF